MVLCVFQYFSHKARLNSHMSQLADRNTDHCREDQNKAKLTQGEIWADSKRSMVV